MRTIFTLLSILIGFGANTFAQNQTMFKGGVTEISAKTDTSAVEYAIYLPENYSVSKPSKALFVFDPNGDGMRAVRLFVSANAGKDHVIVANTSPISASLDSLDVNAEMAINIIRDVFTKVTLDTKQIYLTGMGAGAKTASALSYVFKNISGILLIDDVYFEDKFLVQARRNAVIGVVGESSPNYYQMADFFQMMRNLNKYNELYTYSSSGEWPNASFLGVLLNRLNHFNSKKNSLEISDSLWQENYKEDLSGLRIFVNSKDYLTTYDLSRDLKSDYRGKVELDSLKDFYRSLRKSDVYKNAKRADKTRNVEEILLLDDISYFLEVDILSANFENLGYWDNRIKEFKDSEKNSQKQNEQQVSKRMLGYIDFTLEDFLLNKNALLPQRIFANVLRTMLDAKDYQAYLNIISLSAEDNDDNTAYFYLEELLKQGYTDYDSLYEIPQTTVLKIKPTYNLLINKYLGKSKF